jgi:hypothetical protein
MNARGKVAGGRTPAYVNIANAMSTTGYAYAPKLETGKI